MTDAFQALWAVHKSKNVPLRTAAFVVALERVAKAGIQRGWN